MGKGGLDLSLHDPDTAAYKWARALRLRHFTFPRGNHAFFHDYHLSSKRICYTVHLRFAQNKICWRLRFPDSSPLDEISLEVTGAE